MWTSLAGWRKRVSHLGQASCPVHLDTRRLSTCDRTAYDWHRCAEIRVMLISPLLVAARGRLNSVGEVFGGRERVAGVVEQAFQLWQDAEVRKSSVCASKLSHSRNSKERFGDSIERESERRSNPG